MATEPALASPDCRFQKKGCNLDSLFPICDVSISPSLALFLPPSPKPSSFPYRVYSSKAPCSRVSWSFSPPLNGNPDPLPRHIEAPFPLQARTLRSLGQALHVFSAPSCPPPLGSASPRLGPPGLLSVVTRQSPWGTNLEGTSLGAVYSGQEGHLQ